MTQDNKIWHTPDEQPVGDGNILFYTKTYPLLYAGFYLKGCFYADPDTDYERCLNPNEILEWAYEDEVLLASKALDVAIERIRKWNGAFADKPQYGAFALEFKQALQEINEIMKGGK